MKRSLIPPTAAIILIGDELLSGKIRESNGHYLMCELRRLGIEVTELHMVSDQIERIAEAFLLVKDRNDMVFSCGGLGPTHDDRTFEAAALAWDVKMETRQEITALLSSLREDWRGWEKMARLPQGCELLWHEDSPWPCPRLNNLYLFPGSPQYMKGQFERIRSGLSGVQIHLQQVDLLLDEGHLSKKLNALQLDHDDVSIGSYPVVEDSPYKVRVIFESTNLQSLEAATQQLLSMLEPKDVFKVHPST